MGWRAAVHTRGGVLRALVTEEASPFLVRGLLCLPDTVQHIDVDTVDALRKGGELSTPQGGECFEVMHRSPRSTEPGRGTGLAEAALLLSIERCERHHGRATAAMVLSARRRERSRGMHLVSISTLSLIHI